MATSETALKFFNSIRYRYKNGNSFDISNWLRASWNLLEVIDALPEDQRPSPNDLPTLLRSGPSSSKLRRHGLNVEMWNQAIKNYDWYFGDDAPFTISELVELADKIRQAEYRPDYVYYAQGQYISDQLKRRGVDVRGTGFWTDRAAIEIVGLGRLDLKPRKDGTYFVKVDLENTVLKMINENGFPQHSENLEERSTLSLCATG